MSYDKMHKVPITFSKISLINNYYYNKNWVPILIWGWVKAF